MSERHLNVFGYYRETPRRSDEAPDDDGPVFETNLARAVAVLWRRLALERRLAAHLQLLGAPNDAIEALTRSDDVTVQVECSPAVGSRPVWLFVVAGSDSTVPWTYNRRRVPRDPRPDVVLSSDSAVVIVEFKTADDGPDATQLAVYATRYLRGQPSLEGLPPLPQPGHSYGPDEGLRACDVLSQVVTHLPWNSIRTAVMTHGAGGAQPKEPASAFLARELHAWLAREQVVYGGLKGLEGLVARMAELRADPLDERDQRRTTERLLLAARRHALRLAKEAMPALATLGWLPDPTRAWADAIDGTLAGAGASSDAWLGFVHRDDVRTMADGTVSKRNMGPAFKSKWSYCLWFDFQSRHHDHAFLSWINVEWYVQAVGANVHDRQGPLEGVTDWAQAWQRAGQEHRRHRDTWASAVRALLSSMPDDGFVVAFGALRFNGNRLTWDRGGTSVPGEGSMELPASEALRWLDTPGHLAALWAWPEELERHDLPEVRAASKRIRKPSLSLNVKTPISTSARPDELARWMVTAFETFRRALLASV
jgi:hypothetical protein